MIRQCPRAFRQSTPPREGDCHDVWRHQIPALVAAGYRVIAPDTRGCGDSDAPVGREHYRLGLLVADLVAVLDALGIDKVRLVAHDWGAVIGCTSRSGIRSGSTATRRCR